MAGGPTVCSQGGASTLVSSQHGSFIVSARQFHRPSTAASSSRHGTYIVLAQHLYPPQAPGATPQPKTMPRERGISVISEQLEK